MSDVVEFFNKGWVGSLIGVIGIILAIFFYCTSKSIAKPVYQRSALRLIGRKEDNLPQEVIVTFEGSPVERLARTTLILWNKGTEVLDGKDIVGTDPLRISFLEGDSILSFKVLKQTNDSNNIVVLKDKDNPCSLCLSFDYLNPKDGLVLEILHNSENRYPKITGSIKGIPGGFIDLGSFFIEKYIKINTPFDFIVGKTKVVFGCTIIIGLLFVAYGLLPESIRELIDNFFIDPRTKESLTKSPTFFVILGLIYAAMPAILLWLRRRKYPKYLKYQEVDG